MTRARFRRPADPQDIAARKHERARLELVPDTRVTVSPDHSIISAKRQDVFDLLLTRKSLSQDAHNAVRRLERDLAISEGVTDSDPPAVRLQGSGTHNRLDRRIDASNRADAALASIDPIQSRLLQSLLRPQFQGVIPDWRSIVTLYAGTRTQSTQTRVLVTACDALADAYSATDYAIRKRA